jgi:hypothetical protein
MSCGVCNMFQWLADPLLNSIDTLTQNISALSSLTTGTGPIHTHNMGLVLSAAVFHMQEQEQLYWSRKHIAVCKVCVLEQWHHSEVRLVVLI